MTFSKAMAMVDIIGPFLNQKPYSYQILEAHTELGASEKTGDYYIQFDMFHKVA